MNDPYENIYPLTIVKMRYGGRYVAFNCDNDSKFIDAVQGSEEVYYDVKKYIGEHYYGAYGIGYTLDEAMKILKEWLRK